MSRDVSAVPAPARARARVGQLAAALALLATCSAAPAQLTGPDAVRRDPREVDTDRGGLHPWQEIAESALILLHVDRPDAEAVFISPSGQRHRVTPVGEGRNWFRLRAFHVGRDGETWRILVTKAGWRGVELSVTVVPRTALRFGTLLASRWEADRVLCALPGEGGSAIGCVLPDGSGKSVLCDSEGPDSEPAVSPDGERIAFASGEAGDRRILVFDRLSGATREVIGGGDDGRNPVWLDDATLLWLRGARGDLVVAREGEAPRILPASEGVRRDLALGVASGSALVATDEFGGWELAEVDLATGKATRLTTTPEEDTQPVARPGGDQIAWIASGPSSREVRIARRGSTASFTRIAAAEGATDLAWSADGRLLLWRDASGICAAPWQSSWFARPLAGALPGEWVGWGRLARLPDDVPLVTGETLGGRFLLELDPEGAPEATARFLDSLDAGAYEGTRFHRVVPGMVAQFGCPLGNGVGGPPAVALEPSRIAPLRGAVGFEPDGEGMSPLRVAVLLRNVPELADQACWFGRVTGGIAALDAALARDVLGALQRVRFDEEDLDEAAP